MKVYKLLPILLLGLFLFHQLGKVQAQSTSRWQDWKTVEDIYRAYPSKMEALLQSLNLDLPGMEQVKDAHRKGNTIQACKNLLDYYQKAQTVPTLRRNLPTSSTRTVSSADPLLNNTFTFYSQQAKVPLTSDGHLDWFYQGPANDREWAFALNRHAFLGNLMDAYFSTGNSVYVQKIDHIIKDWVIKSLPYPQKQTFTSMWRSLEVSFRVKKWVEVFYGLLKSEHFSPATRLLLLSSITEHGHFLRNFHGTNNWLTTDMSALVRAATAWSEFKSASDWLAYSENAMTKSMQEQVYPDGVQTELSSHYHWVALNEFNQFQQIYEETNLTMSSAYTGQLEKMWNYLAYALRPSGTNPLNNDSDLGNYQSRINSAASTFQRPDWLYIGTNGKEGSRPAQTSILFPYAGQAILRNGWDKEAQWAFFDIGPWGVGHQHNDKLHLSLSAYGRDLLVDAGRFAYEGSLADKFRSYARGSTSHNVLLIDGKEQANGPTLALAPLGDKDYKLSDKLDYARGSIDYFKDLTGKAEHVRSLSYVKGKFWIVVDQIHTDRPRMIDALWHWHPESKVVIKPDGSVGTENGRGNLQIIPVGEQKWDVHLVRGQESPKPQGWYSEKYNQATPNTTSIYRTFLEKDGLFVWLMLPSEGVSPVVEAKITSRGETEMTVLVKTSEGQWEVRIPFLDSARSDFVFRSSGSEPYISVLDLLLDEKQLTLDINRSRQLTATILPENATNQQILWSSSDPSVASVDNNGKVTVQDYGTATISASSQADPSKSRSVLICSPKSAPTNLALRRKVVASAVPQSQHPPSSAVDGNTADLSRWSAKGFPNWLELDLGSRQAINRIELIALNDRPYQYYIEVRKRVGDAYEKIVDRTSNTEPAAEKNPLVDLFCDPIDARYVKITVTGLSDNTSDWVSLIEFRVFGKKIPNSVTSNTVDFTPGLDVYPNPSKGKVFIGPKNPNLGIQEIFIFNSMGQQVWSETYDFYGAQETLTLDLSHLSPGVYFLSSKIDGIRVQQKLILTR